MSFGRVLARTGLALSLALVSSMSAHAETTILERLL